MRGLAPFIFQLSFIKSGLRKELDSGQKQTVLAEGHRSYRMYIEGHYQMYWDVAKQRGFLLIDHYPNWESLKSKDEKLFQKYVPDSIHPTAEGSSQVVTPVILETLGGEEVV